MILLFLLIFAVVLAILATAHWYVWRRLIRDTTAPRTRWRRAGTAVFIAGPVLAVGALAGEQAGLPHTAAGIVAWPGYLWLALFLYLFLGVLAGEVVRPLISRLLAARSKEPASAALTKEPASVALSKEPATAGAITTPVKETVPVGATGPDSQEPGPSPVPGELVSRRVFVSRVVGGAAAVVAAGTVGAGTYSVMNGPSIKRITVPLAKLPRSAHGMRIAVVSDVHLGPVLGRRFCQGVVDTINSTQPDLIAVVGDLIDGDVEDLADSVEPLRGLTSRLGTFFVTGNHEYISGVEPWVEKVRELGMQPLRNARVPLAGLDLAGVDDVQGVPDFGAALDDRDRSRPVVLLAHQPVNIHEAVEHGVDLQLSGHTHGGQMWPGNYIAELANPTNSGLERYGDTQLYVSRGAGAWGPPVRVGAPSDITIVQLASPQA
ncbi:putative metallophosphoesterase [Actinoplanes missouriensis 431]|uniref:Putative metallophosphoesterase n=1 Tax=Actinoplanes missouriensis (strain ATCC 14538 / DSM 43046 / CBS 188.64 / JCM 3121 / NBRC 102363 / NCIMB 12654 / NRRL B-3342 / UNCC 431) TaxID=512565 RepID=I0H9V7_ACTM4|nr:metallophosphoesterase [Actinoplanes missouriensis]BAL89794.1 putative metallophosphoesterase [Actinoplanes missouriensis 431]